MSEKKTVNKKEERNKKAIVKYRSELGFVPLQNFTSREIDLFFGLCYKVQNQGTNRVTIKFDELKSLLDFKQRSNTQMIEELKQMSIKFSQLKIMDTTNTKGFKIVIPFIDFEADGNAGTFSVGVHPQFAVMLNDIDPKAGDRYSLSDAITISKFKSIYSKHCYKMLMNYRATGRWITTIETFRYSLCIPKSYSQGDISRRVISEIEKDFSESGAFKNYNIIEKKESAGKGRPKVVGYTFEFELNNDAPSSIPVIEVGGAEESIILCPVCNKPLSKINKKNGKGFFFGHPDFWVEDAACKQTYKSLDEIKIASASVESEQKKAANKKAKEERALINAYLKAVRDNMAKQREKRIEGIRNYNPEIFELYEQENKLTADFISMVGTLADKEKRQETRRKRDSVAEEKRNALEKAGFDRNFLEVQFKCDICKDQGYLPNGSACECIEVRLKEAKEWNKNRGE